MKRFFFYVILISLVSLSFSVGRIYAAEAIPKKAPYPCVEDSSGWNKDFDFNSGRPYQASPCQDAPYAAMCGNNISVVIDHVNVEWDESKGCTDELCPYYKDPGVQEKHVVIDLSGVKLPILGNSQNVTNSQNPEDELDDAQKTNEYAAWYLNGVNQKAEYGPDTIDKVINFSGPAKKLLPSAIQELNRFKTLHNVGVLDPVTLEEQDAAKIKDTDPKEPGIQTEQTANHNQIVVCTTNVIDINILGFNLIIPWIGEDKPIPCYGGANKKHAGNEYRLLDWWDRKNVGYLPSLELLKNWNPYSGWDFAVPPFPWQFKKEVYYQKAYNEWKGKNCLLVPISEKLFCVDVRFPGTRLDIKPNKWANLYPYIPLANTVDKKGKEDYSSVHVDSQRAEIERHQENSDTEGTVINSVPRLYYPHTQDVLESTENLNKTFIPSNGSSNSIGTNTEDNTSTCQILNVRTNAGDDLTFDDLQDKQRIDFNVFYSIKSVKCTTKEEGKLDSTGAYYTKTIHNCDADITAEVNLTTLVPNLNDIWKDTVAGNESTFRKIFPKVEEGAPVSCIADIPGVSQADYVLNEDLSSGGVKNLNVKNPGGSTSVTPEIYFPHLGSVYEYFLKGIQTALRPQGYGEPIVNGTTCSTAVCGELPNLPRASGSCNLGSVSSRVGNIPQSLRDIVSAAANTYKTPPNLILAQMFGEGLFNPGKFDWSDSNIKNWATCEKFPGCSETGADNFMGFYSGDWPTIAKAISGDLKAVDPNHKAPNQCNLIDAIYGAAWNLHDSADGSSTFLNPESGAPYSCLGHALNTGSNVPTSCIWDASQYESAIRIAEFGTGWGQTSRGFFTCATKDNSCLTGGGPLAQCPTDTVNNPDTCAKFGNNSHNLCLWDVAHGN